MGTGGVSTGGIVTGGTVNGGVVVGGVIVTGGIVTGGLAKVGGLSGGFAALTAVVVNVTTNEIAIKIASILLIFCLI
jgi:hypothetical protein